MCAAAEPSFARKRPIVQEIFNFFNAVNFGMPENRRSTRVAVRASADILTCDAVGGGSATTDGQSPTPTVRARAAISRSYRPFISGEESRRSAVEPLQAIGTL